MTLRHINIVAWSGLATVSAALVYAFAAGHFATDWPRLVENPFGLATLVDVYVGFALFSCWIFWREARFSTASLWVLMVLVGGNVVSAVYVLVALRASNGTVESFWFGSRCKRLNVGNSI